MGDILVKYLFLTQEFYTTYNETDYPEIERKSERPYILVKINIDGLDFGIPLRSGVNHKYALWTDKANHCGADYSKAVLILDESYIDVTDPYVRPNEHNVLKGKEYLLKNGFESYINKYKKSLNKLHIKQCKDICDFSTLQYYHKELSID